MGSPRPLRWTVYCRVVDNLGDIGVCWRLARDLGSRGDAVTLVVDDASALAWMAPHGARGVAVVDWPAPGAVDTADVVVEAFGCALPQAALAALAARHAQRRAPVWLNLEYLSAESYVERSHALPSPQPGRLPPKWFFFPGFTPRTGGLLREPGLIDARSRFDRDAWLAARGWPRAPGERVVTLFGYANTAFAALLADLASAPTLLLVAPGAAQQQLAAAAHLPPTLRAVRLPWLDHDAYDRLLWSADLNGVRGEDSLVRAVWAGAPLLWQAYPQDDGAHHAKVDALLARIGVGEAVAAAWRAWNGAPGARWPGLPPADAWQPALAQWRAGLLALPDLTTALRDFVCGKSLGSAPVGC